MIARLGLMILLAAPALGKDAAPKKPRMNGWLALYDLAGRKGTFWQRTDVGGMRSLEVPNGSIWVPVTSPGTPISGDTCEIRINYVDPSIGKYLPELKDDPSFQTENFTLTFDDKGCKGTFANLNWQTKHTIPERAAHMRKFLTPAIFDYLGLVYLKGARNYLHID